MSNPKDIYDEVPTITSEMLTEHFDKLDAATVAKRKPEKKVPINIKQAQEQTAVKVTTNQRKLVTADTYASIVSKYGDPLEEMAKIAFEKQTYDDGTTGYVNPVEVRATVLKELVKYGHAQLKTIEHTGANGAPLEFKMSVVQNILQMINKDEPRTITESE